MATVEEQVAQEQAEYEAEAETLPPDGEDADEGKLFEVPRVAVVVDESDPNVLKLAFSGSVELDRTNAGDVEFFNGLVPGRNYDLAVSVFVAGSPKTHRRDSDGNVDSVVQTKSLKVHSVETS
jgi:hypothetical protein